MPLALALRRALLATLASLALSAPAFAQGGINLSWDDCGSYGAAAKTFACDTNAGEDVLFGSAVSGMDMNVFGVEATITIVVDGPTLSNWWHLETSNFTSACRKGAFSASSDFSAGPHHCVDPWGTPVTSAQAYDVPGYPNQGRLRIIGVTPDQSTRPVNATDEYEYFKVIITHAKTVGTNSCAGCSGGAILYLMSVQLDQLLGEGDLKLTEPLQRSFVTWQGGSPVAAHRTTWGAVKSLYR